MDLIRRENGEYRNSTAVAALPLIAAGGVAAFTLSAASWAEERVMNALAPSGDRRSQEAVIAHLAVLAPLVAATASSRVPKELRAMTGFLGAVVGANLGLVVRDDAVATQAQQAQESAKRAANIAA